MKMLKYKANTSSILLLHSFVKNYYFKSGKSDFKLLNCSVILLLGRMRGLGIGHTGDRQSPPVPLEYCRKTMG